MRRRSREYVREISGACWEYEEGDGDRGKQVAFLKCLVSGEARRIWNCELIDGVRDLSDEVASA